MDSPDLWGFYTGKLWDSFAFAVHLAFTIIYHARGERSRTFLWSMERDGCVLWTDTQEVATSWILNITSSVRALAWYETLPHTLKCEASYWGEGS